MSATAKRSPEAESHRRWRLAAGSSFERGDELGGKQRAPGSTQRRAHPSLAQPSPAQPSPSHPTSTHPSTHPISPSPLCRRGRSTSAPATLHSGQRTRLTSRPRKHRLVCCRSLWPRTRPFHERRETDHRAVGKRHRQVEKGEGVCTWRRCKSREEGHLPANQRRGRGHTHLTGSACSSVCGECGRKVGYSPRQPTADRLHIRNDGLLQCAAASRTPATRPPSIGTAIGLRDK